MSVSGIGGGSSYAYQGMSGSKSAAKNPSTDGNSELQNLEAYFYKSPAERMQERWLAAHHITQQELDSMSPEKRDAIKKQMAEEIKQELKKRAEQNITSGVNILV